MKRLTSNAYISFYFFSPVFLNKPFTFKLNVHNKTE